MERDDMLENVTRSAVAVAACAVIGTNVAIYLNAIPLVSRMAIYLSGFAAIYLIVYCVFGCTATLRNKLFSVKGFAELVVCMAGMMFLYGFLLAHIFLMCIPQTYDSYILFTMGCVAASIAIWPISR